MNDNSMQPGYLKATGPVQVNMTNDYMFRAVLQKSNDVLVALICSLLHLPREKVHSAVIINPVVLGQHLDEKQIILDINVYFDDSTYVNLEMQVADEHDWIERSLTYLCRNFTHLRRGQNYIDVQSAIQIGILNYTLFEDDPAFYASYYMMNPASRKIYSDKLRISVLDLTRTDEATEDDLAHGIDIWARLFKAQTWEEIKMLAAKDNDIAKAAGSIYDLSADEAVMWECIARDDYIRRKNDARLLLERAETCRKEEKRKRKEAEQQRKVAEQKRREEKRKREEAERERDESLKLADRYRQMLADHGIDVDGIGVPQV